MIPMGMSALRELRGFLCGPGDTSVEADVRKKMDRGARLADKLPPKKTLAGGKGLQVLRLH